MRSTPNGLLQFGWARAPKMCSTIPELPMYSTLPATDHLGCSIGDELTEPATWCMDRDNESACQGLPVLLPVSAPSSGDETTTTRPRAGHPGGTETDVGRE